jgi:hypothetical protein
MLKTQQRALLQATNQQLIQIRTNELNYYLNNCSIFGQQAALIAGWTNYFVPYNFWLTEHRIL